MHLDTRVHMRKPREPNMSIKMRFMRFCKSREVHNFLITEHDKMLAERKKRAARYEVLKHTKTGVTEYV